MSRREARESDSKRHRSRFDREPSPKRSRRDGKPSTEKPSGNAELGTRNHSDRDQKPQSRMQDALPHEAAIAPDTKVETRAASKDIDKQNVASHERIKHSSDLAEIPRPRSFFQHDERGRNARQVDRSFSRGSATERGWWRDSKDRSRERVTNRKANSDIPQRDEKYQAGKDENGVWRHDGFSKMEADPPPPARRRPSFSEKKTPVDPENAEKALGEHAKPSHPTRPILESGRREERGGGGHNSRHLERPEKPMSGNREQSRGEAQRSGFPSKERYGGNGSYRGRERFDGRQGYRPSGVRVEKWKHDMFHEANRSPTPKNEDDQIAKVEALLAS